MYMRMFEYTESKKLHYDFWILSFTSNIAGQALEDQCSKKPCKNGGECIQVRFGRYKCDCQGTKHYGEHCDDGNSRQNKTFNG